MFANSFVCRETPGGVLVMSNRPKKPEVPTAHQVATGQRFTLGTYYAKAQMKIPAAKAEYEAAVSDKLQSAYAVAVADYLKGPEVPAIDASSYNGAVGDTIVITAIDNFKVTEVTVEIRNVLDQVIETGAAVIDSENPALWIYVTTVANATVAGTKVVVRAKDKPKNLTTKEFILA